MISSASSSASPTGVSVSCEPVITSVGTVIVGSSARSSSLASRMARTCAMNGSGFVCISTRASTLIQTPKRRCNRGPTSQRMPSSSAIARIPRSPTTSAHSSSSSRRQSWWWHAVQASVSDMTRLAVQHADDLGDDATHRRADDVRTFDAFGVEHLDRVFGHPEQVVRARRRVDSHRYRGCRGRRSGACDRTIRAGAPTPGCPCRDPGSCRQGVPSRLPHTPYAILTPSVVRMSGTDESSGCARVTTG